MMQNSAVDTILHALAQRPHAYLIAIAGVPGSGKTTLCKALHQQMPGSIIVPADGYHIPKAQLDEEGLRRRGLPRTFDKAACRRDLVQLKTNREGKFPAFEHEEQDPRYNAIDVTRDHQPVIVEGLYLLMRDWQLEPLFDLKVFLDCPLDVCVDRVAARHLACGLCETPGQARARAEGNDRLNSLTILADGCRERADLVIPC
jgi:pantothenate kinase